MEKSEKIRSSSLKEMQKAFMDSGGFRTGEKFIVFSGNREGKTYYERKRYKETRKLPWWDGGIE